MAPEQARDARSVDIRADIYALGGTLYWLLTAERPFPSDRPVFQELLARQYETPRPPRQLRPDIPLELEAIICQMMARDPCDRYPTPLAVISALDDFLESFTVHADASSPSLYLSDKAASSIMPSGLRAAAACVTCADTSRAHRVLLFSALPELRRRCRQALDQQGFHCGEAGQLDELPDAIGALAPELIVVHNDSGDEVGLDVCRRLRAEPPAPHLKIMLLIDTPEDDFCADAELCDDVLTGGEVQGQLLRRVRMLLRLREVEDRSDRLAGHLLATNGQLEQLVQQRDNSTSQAQDVLIFAMAKMAELRGQESGAHLLRMQQYVRVLAEEAMRLPAFAGVIDDTFVRMIERCVLLHDIGKVAIPDHILLKPGKLDVEERSIMESHTMLGANLLEAVARQHGACLAFLNMAVEIVRHHHEHYDGGGYPDSLAGDAIPLAARITAIADVYDAMRSKLVYKPGLAHPAARRLMLSPDSGQFDPALLVAFKQCDEMFKDIFERTTD
jgi:response regulator RpfG family c-di-GMP phosphodiesterase